MKNLNEYKLEEWQKHGKVLVKRDRKGRIIQWCRKEELDDSTVERLLNSSVIIQPLTFTTKNKNISRTKKPKTKKKKITIKLSTDLVNLLNFLKGRKSLGNLIEELIKEALKQYQTL